MQAELTPFPDTSAFLSKNLLHFLCAKTSTKLQIRTKLTRASEARFCDNPINFLEKL